MCSDGILCRERGVSSRGILTQPNYHRSVHISDVFFSSRRYVEEDLKEGLGKEPAQVLSARPMDDPLEIIMYLTRSVVSGVSYNSSLRARIAFSLFTLYTTFNHYIVLPNNTNKQKVSESPPPSTTPSAPSAKHAPYASEPSKRNSLPSTYSYYGYWPSSNYPPSPY